MVLNLLQYPIGALELLTFHSQVENRKSEFSVPDWFEKIVLS